MQKAIFLISLFVCCCVITSCDDGTPGVPLPASLTLLSEEATINNGESFEVRFRVTPADYPVDVKRVFLNLANRVFMDGSYAEIKDYHYEITKLEKGETEGDWIAEVTSDLDLSKPYGESFNLYLELSGGRRSMISGNSMKIENYPLFSEHNIRICWPRSQSYMTLETHLDKEENKIAEFASAYVYARPVEPMTSYYNWEEVTMEVTLEDPTLPFVVTETEGGNGLMFQVTPTEDIFENIYQDYIPVKVNIKLTDKYGNVIIRQEEIKFYRSVFILPAGERFTFTESQVKGDGMFEIYTLDLSSIALRLGLTPEFLEVHKRSAFSTSNNSWIVKEDGTTGEGLFFHIDPMLDKDIIEPDALKEVEVVNLLAYNSLVPFGTHYAALYVIVLDPYTRAPMLNLDIRQEVKIVKDPIVD